MTTCVQEYSGSSGLGYHRRGQRATSYSYDSAIIAKNPKLEFDPEVDNQVLKYSINIGSQVEPDFIFAASEIANRTYDFHESTQKFDQGHQFQLRRNDFGNSEDPILG